MKFPVFPKSSWHPIFCNDSIHHLKEKINKNIGFFPLGKKTVKAAGKRKIAIYNSSLL